MKEKYVEGRFNRYFEFGTHEDGKVDLASQGDETICTVTKSDAKKLIKLRNEAVDMIVTLALKLDEVSPEEFDKLWYSQRV